MYEPQEAALKSWQTRVRKSVLDGLSALVVAPTGSGKSHLALSLAQDFRRKLWVLPTKALTREWFMRALGTVSVKGRLNIYTGDYKRESSFYEGDLVFATYESAILQLRRKDPWFRDLELFIFDEFQFIGDEDRGGAIEELLILLSELNPSVRVLALSATIGNPEELANWMSRLFERRVELFSIPVNERPVRLIQQALRFKHETEKRRHLLNLVISRGNEQFLVFTPRRHDAENLSAYFRAAGIRAGVHHAGLDRLSRVSAEDDFRTGKLQVLFCTATLQYGVNMPAHWVVIYDPVWNSRSGEFRVDTNDFLQMAGRAGRPIPDPTTKEMINEGKVLVLSTDKREHLYVKTKLINQEAEPVHSSFEHDLIFRVHGFLLYKSANELRHLLMKSLAKIDRRQVEHTFTELTRMGFLQDGALTSLGRYVAELNLHPHVAARFLRKLNLTGSNFGTEATEIVFSVLKTENSFPPGITQYRDLLKRRLVKRSYLDGTLLVVNYQAPQQLRDRAAWYLYAFEKLADYIGRKEIADAIAKERAALEGLNDVYEPVRVLGELLTKGKTYIEVAVREYDELTDTGRASWLGFNVTVDHAPRGLTEPVRIVNLSGKSIHAEPSVSSIMATTTANHGTT